MNIEQKERFTEVRSSEGNYLTDDEGKLIGSIAFFPLAYDTGKLREISEEEKEAMELEIREKTIR